MYLVETAFLGEHLEAPAVGLGMPLPGVLVKVEVLASLPLAELPELLSGCYPHSLPGETRRFVAGRGDDSKR